MTFYIKTKNNRCLHISIMKKCKMYTSNKYILYRIDDIKNLTNFTESLINKSNMVAKRQNASK